MGWPANIFYTLILLVTFRSKNFANAGTSTMDPRCQERPLCQKRHNHDKGIPSFFFFFLFCDLWRKIYWTLIGTNYRLRTKQKFWKEFLTLFFKNRIFFLLWKVSIFWIAKSSREPTFLQLWDSWRYLAQLALITKHYIHLELSQLVNNSHSYRFR